jgi:F-type H+-transporting ATPase subunit b
VSLFAATLILSWWDYLEYPGFEAWKFFNLFLFVGLMAYVLRRPISGAMRARREGIRQELRRAQEEKEAALKKLAEIDARLEKLDDEVGLISERARIEAQAERERMRQATEEDARKMREQARREIENASKVAMKELREFAINESVRIAEDLIRRDLRPEDDDRMFKYQVDELGGLEY